MSRPGGGLVRNRTVSMGSIGSSFSGEDESLSTPKFKGGNSPERLSPIPSGKGMSPREDHKGNNLKASRSESVIDKAEEKKHLTVMEPFGKRITYVDIRLGW